MRGAVKFLESYIPTPDKKYPGSLGLDRMRQLVDILGNPQNSFKSIHIGGTSGKGSTATILSCLLEARYKVGLHISPHLVDIRERIQINNKLISKNDFIDLVNSVRPAVEEMEKGKMGRPSFFEILTVMAFLNFARMKVDWAVVEVGMGGRFDATNVIKSEVAVLTNVGLDHTEVLGETIEEIAQDKAGIFKKRGSVVTGVKQATVREIVEAESGKYCAGRSFLGVDFHYRLKKITDHGSYFDYLGEEKYENLFVPLLGEHQIENASLAIAAVERVIGEKEIRKGLAKVFIPGRMEIVRKKPLIILDGAHNRDKAEALAKAIKRIFPNKMIRSIVAIKNDKEAEKILRFIMPLSSELILTRFQILGDVGLLNSYPPDRLKEIAENMGSGIRIIVIQSIKDALDYSIKTSGKDDLILITGSLYLVGEFKKIPNSKYQIPNGKK